MLGASAGARAVAEDARGAFKENGVYLPASAGPHGMVFEIDRVAGRLCLLYVGLGLRHPSRDMRQPSVYQVAHRRLHSGPEN
jgi:hypothetical protein